MKISEINIDLIREEVFLRKNKSSAFVLVDLFANSDQGKIELYYILRDYEKNSEEILKVLVPSGRKVPSIANVLENSNWCESEIYDLYGVHFEGNSNLFRAYTRGLANGNPSIEQVRFNVPSYKKKKIENWDYSISIGQMSHSNSGVMSGVFGIQNDLIEDCIIDPGLLHRGIENLCEKRTYAQNLQLIEKLNYISGPQNTSLYCNAVESCLAINIPDKAVAIRMIFMELARVFDHLNCLQSMVQISGAGFPIEYNFDFKSLILDLYESYSGKRLFPNCSIFGGVNFELPLAWISDCFEMITLLTKHVNEISNYLTRSSAWFERSKSGHIGATDALLSGFSGPVLRASGINYDLRKNNPYYFYNDVEFEVPLGVYGDSYDRYMVRMEEIKQSFKIMAQILDNIPSGPIKVDLRDLGFLKDNENLLLDLKIPLNSIYTKMEGSNGEIGVFLKTNGESVPNRLRFRSPSFFHAQSFNKVLKGCTLTEAEVGLESLNINASEMDK